MAVRRCPTFLVFSQERRPPSNSSSAIEVGSIARDLILAGGRTLEGARRREVWRIAAIFALDAESCFKPLRGRSEPEGLMRPILSLYWPYRGL
jgi:hypothetical protein